MMYTYIGGTLHKVCSKCVKPKLLTAFHANTKTRDGKQSYCKECIKDYQETNKQQMYVNQRAHYKRNRLKKRTQVRNWQLANHDKTHAHDTVRRLRLRRAEGKLTNEQWGLLKRLAANCCLACGKATTKLHADHVVALSKGGANSVKNRQPLCSGCNLSKGTKTIDYRTAAYKQQLRVAGLVT